MDDVEEIVKQFPELDPEMVRKQYTQAAKLGQARRGAATTTESWGDYSQRKLLPLVSTGVGLARDVSYGNALKRMQEGKPEEADYQTIADYERVQEQDRQRTSTLGGALGEAVATMPALIGEFALGSAAVKGAAAIAPKALSAYIAAPAVAQKVSLPVWAGQKAAQTGALTLAVPSMWAHRWTDNNIEQGRDPLDLKGFPAAFGMGMAHTAILGSMQNQLPYFKGPGVKNFLARAGTKGALGVGEMAAADMVGKWAGLTTKYGSMQDFMEGKYGEGAKNAAVSALTFALFSAYHEGIHGTPQQRKIAGVLATPTEEIAPQGPQPGIDPIDAIGKRFTEAVDAQKAMGRSAARAAENAAKPFDVLKELLADNVDPTPEEVAAAMKELPAGPIRSLGMAISDHWEKYHDQGRDKAVPQQPQAEMPAPVPPIPSQPPPQPERVPVEQAGPVDIPVRNIGRAAPAPYGGPPPAAPAPGRVPIEQPGQKFDIPVRRIGARAQELSGPGKVVDPVADALGFEPTIRGDVPTSRDSTRGKTADPREELFAELTRKGMSRDAAIAEVKRRMPWGQKGGADPAAPDVVENANKAYRQFLASGWSPKVAERTTRDTFKGKLPADWVPPESVSHETKPPTAPPVSSETKPIAPEPVVSRETKPGEGRSLQAPPPEPERVPLVGKAKEAVEARIAELESQEKRPTPEIRERMETMVEMPEVAAYLNRRAKSAQKPLTPKEWDGLEKLARDALDAPEVLEKLKEPRFALGTYTKKAIAAENEIRNLTVTDAKKFGAAIGTTEGTIEPTVPKDRINGRPTPGDILYVRDKDGEIIDISRIVDVQDAGESWKLKILPGRAGGRHTAEQAKAYEAGYTGGDEPANKDDRSLWSLGARDAKEMRPYGTSAEGVPVKAAERLERWMEAYGGTGAPSAPDGPALQEVTKTIADNGIQEAFDYAYGAPLSTPGLKAMTTPIHAAILEVAYERWVDHLKKNPSATKRDFNKIVRETVEDYFPSGSLVMRGLDRLASENLYGAESLKTWLGSGMEATAQKADLVIKAVLDRPDDVPQFVRQIAEHKDIKSQSKIGPTVQRFLDDGILVSDGVRTEQGTALREWMEENNEMQRLDLPNSRAQVLKLMVHALWKPPAPKGKPKKVNESDMVDLDALMSPYSGRRLQAPPQEAPPTTQTLPSGKGQTGAVGPFEIIKTIERESGLPAYSAGKSRTASGSVVDSPMEYNDLVQAMTVPRMREGDAPAVSHEWAHHIATTNKIDLDPAKLPPDVAKGLQEMDYDAARRAGPPSRLGMDEGFAEWFRQRLTGTLAPKTPAQQAAADWAEKQLRAAPKALKSADKVKGLFEQYKAQSPTQQFGGFVSGTAEPAKPVRTVGEQVKDAATIAQENFSDAVVDRLAAANRFEADRLAKGNAPAKPGQDLPTLMRRLEGRNQQLADEIRDKGTYYINPDGTREYTNRTVKGVYEDLAPEDVRAVGGETGEGFGGLMKLFTKQNPVSEIDAYATARTLVDNANRGKFLVPQEEIRKAEALLKEVAADPARQARMADAANKMTQIHNDLMILEAELGLRDLKEVRRQIRQDPTYLPLVRVKEDAAQALSAGPQERKGSGEQIVAPSITLQDAIRVTADRINKQRIMNTLVEGLGQKGMGAWGVVQELSPGEQAEAMGQMMDPKPWPKNAREMPLYWHGPDARLRKVQIGDRALYETLTGQQGDANALVQTMRGLQAVGLNLPGLGKVKPFELAQNAIRLGATGAKLAFQVANIPRDMYAFYKNTIDRVSVGELLQGYGRMYAVEWANFTKRWTGKESNDIVARKYIESGAQALRELGFDPNRPASAYDPLQQRGPAIKAWDSASGIVKDLLGVLGAGEQGPRFTEWLSSMRKQGWSEAKLRTALEKSEADRKAGRMFTDPIPEGVGLAAMDAAAEVTTPFQRTGYLTKELNKIVPFFGPAVAGLSKELRNWRTNPTAAGVALASYLGLRTLWWAMNRDKDWYDQLSETDRNTNFVVETPWGLRRLPGLRGLDVPIGGAWLSVLDAARGKNPQLPGLVQETFRNTLPPGLDRTAAALTEGKPGQAALEAAVTPLGPMATVGLDVARNKSWSGVPIVPFGQENLPGTKKFTDYELPYAMKQLTGGRGEASVSGLGLNVAPKVVARQAVNDFHDRLKELESLRRASPERRVGKVFPQEAEYQRLVKFHDKIVELAALLRGEVKGKDGRVQQITLPPERERELQALQVRLAKRALSRE